MYVYGNHIAVPICRAGRVKKHTRGRGLAQRRSQTVVVGLLVAALPDLHDKDTVDTNKCAPMYTL